MRPRRPGSPRAPGHVIVDTAATVVVALTLFVAAPPAPASARPCLAPPVVAPVSRPFSAPPCPWCAGHRGVTFAVAPGTVVRAMAPGIVTFSGIVVEVRYVVVRHGDGLLATYGGLASSPVAAGDRVGAGDVVGLSGGDLYVGLRVGPDRYIDPEPLIGALVVPPYLVPTDGTPARRRPRRCCAAGGESGSPGRTLGPRPVSARPARCARSRSERRRGAGGSAPARSRRRRSRHRRALRGPGEHGRGA